MIERLDYSIDSVNSLLLLSQPQLNPFNINSKHLTLRITPLRITFPFIWKTVNNHSKNVHSFFKLAVFEYCQTLGLVLRQRVDFVLPLSQEEQEEQEQEQPLTKIYQKGVYWKAEI